MSLFNLVCIAPDGERIHEGAFESVEAAWGRSSDMGSRWFFYPVHVVTGASRSDLARIVAALPGADVLVGKSLRSVSKIFAENAQEITDWVNGDSVFPL